MSYSLSFPVTEAGPLASVPNLFPSSQPSRPSPKMGEIIHYNNDKFYQQVTVIVKDHYLSNVTRATTILNEVQGETLIISRHFQDPNITQLLHQHSIRPLPQTLQWWEIIQDQKCYFFGIQYKALDLYSRELGKILKKEVPLPWTSKGPREWRKRCRSQHLQLEKEEGERLERGGSNICKYNKRRIVSCCFHLSWKSPK